MKYCPKCSREYENMHGFCEDCGEKLLFKEDIIKEDVTISNDVEQIAFCEECGIKNEGTSKFCESCGHQLGTDILIEGSEKEGRSSKRKRKYVIAVCIMTVLIGVLFGAYKFGENYYSKSNQVKRYQEILLTSDSEKLVTILNSTDRHFKLNKDNLKIYSNYLKDNTAYLADMVDNLSSSSASKDDIYLKNNGKYFFLYDKYDLMFQPIYFNVTTNTNGMRLVVNGKAEKAVSEKDFYTWKLGPFSPGIYEFAATFNYNGEEISIDQKVEQIDREDIRGKNMREISFEMTKIKMDLISDIDEGEILVDGKSVKKLAGKGKTTTLELIWRDYADLQIKQKFGELELISESLDFIPGDYLAEDYSKDRSNFYIPQQELGISSNVSSGDIYLNDKQIGTLTDSNLDSLTFVTTGTPLKFQAKQIFEDGSEIASSVVDYEKDDSYRYQGVYLEFPSDVDEYQVADFLSGLYSNVTDYTNENKDFENSEIITLESYFENGSANHEFIDFKDNYILPTRVSKTKAYINTSLSKVESVKRIGSNIYEVRYIVNYYTNYKDDTPNVDQYFRYKKAIFVLTDEGNLLIRNLGGTANFEEVSESEVS